MSRVTTQAGSFSRMQQTSRVLNLPNLSRVCAPASPTFQKGWDYAIFMARRGLSFALALMPFPKEWCVYQFRHSPIVIYGGAGRARTCKYLLLRPTAKCRPRCVHKLANTKSHTPPVFSISTYSLNFMNYDPSATTTKS